MNPIVAQDHDACPVIVDQALQISGDRCAETGRNEACYGHNQVEVEVRAGSTAAAFSDPGDKLAVAEIETLVSSPLDVEAGTWGITLLRIQANIPGTLPGQNVQFMLLGDTTVRRTKPAADAQTVTIDAIATGGANVRQGPSTTDPVIGGLAAGDAIILDGRIEDSSWFRFRAPESVLEGWIYAQLVTPSDDVAGLPVVESGSSDWGPMQAFYFSSGVGQSRCEELPPSGLMVQTPGGVGEISLNINAVTINLASSAFIQAIPDEELRVNMLEGRGRIAAFGVEQIALTGTTVTVPIDNQLTATGPPRPPRMCLAADLQNLPVEYWNCTLVEVHVPDECPATIPSDAELLVSLPTRSGGFDTQEEAESAVGAAPVGLAVDGAVVAFQDAFYQDGNGRVGHDLQYNWNNPPSGVYQVEGTLFDGGAVGCTLTVVDVGN